MDGGPSWSHHRLTLGQAFAHVLELPQRGAYEADLWTSLTEPHALYRFFGVIGGPIEVAADVGVVVLTVVLWRRRRAWRRALGAAVRRCSSGGAPAGRTGRRAGGARRAGTGGLPLEAELGATFLDAGAELLAHAGVGDAAGFFQFGDQPVPAALEVRDLPVQLGAPVRRCGR
jgi:hypothetical protein